MSKSGMFARCSAVAIGTVLLVGVAGAALAEENHGDQGVDVSVAIAPLEVPGVLAMSVSNTNAALIESDSGDPLVRQFSGSLPTVTVTDTRSVDEIADDAFWYVVGSSTEFTGTAGQPAISAGHLGWIPELLDGGDAGLVMEGDPVDTVMDEGPDAVGLVDQELFASAFDSQDVASEGQWTATADLLLRTDATVAPGDYTARLTLSLFE